MKHTREQMHEMSDHTLNHVLYASLYYTSNDELPALCPDYCNDWSAIMPLAVEYEISLISGLISAATNKPYEFTNDKISDPDFHAIGGYQFVEKIPTTRHSLLFDYGVGG